MKKYEFILLVKVWVLPLVAALFFKSMYPLFGWAASVGLSYFIITYESEKD